ncbi:hypothetical protein LP418_19475 [Nocardioides sp. B-3]|nr:hypothetical protein [Nocardioides sp. B-3]UUZ58362.1 hypothetical protein LP418_19475 [Nocardioides sp. B-3]
MISSQSCTKARILQVSSTKRTPALTKKLIRPTTFSKSSSETCPEFLTWSSTAIAVHNA